MISNVDYALMAGRSYQSTRDPGGINWFPIPQGWSPFFHVPDSNTPTFATTDGFEAISFQNGNDIVISYAGTYDKDLTGDLVADAGLALGTGSIQLLQAAKYYLQVRAANTINGIPPNITLTGHSLGGGLAALIGVLFGVEAHTFDQAPFAQTALFKAQSLLDELLAEKNGSGAPLYTSTQLQGLTNFIQLQQANGGIPNSNLVSNIRVEGEFLSVWPIGMFNTIGTPANLTTLQHGPTSASGTELHAQALLTAFLQSDQTAITSGTVKQTLSQVTTKLTDLLKLIFDESLFAHRTDTGIENFLERLVKHEAGVRDPATGTTTLAPDAMLTRFTRDLWKLAQDGGLTLNDGNGLPTTYSNWNNISKALTAFAMQMYYEDTANATNANKELFTQVTGGIQFDMADVSKTFATAFQNNEKLNLNDAKGYKEYFAAYLSDNPHAFFTPEERGLITAMLPYLRDWYVQAGTSGMLATDTQSRGAFMLGGAGQDTLTGGT
ncbi:MAG: hypothetical protein K8H75_01050, partial [Sulfuricella sp.]|nr:hypothetical protein [Sulfuricella sp.]